MDPDLIVTSLQEMGRGFVARIPYLVVGLVVFLLFAIAGRVVRSAIRVAGDRTALDPVLAELLGGLASVFMAFLGLLIGAVVIFPTFKPGDLLAGLGITSVAVGFAFKDILQNWLAGVFILWRRPFQIGDEIGTRSYEGRVEDINVRATVLRTYDGERVVVPSSEVYTSAVLVKTAHTHRRVRFTAGIGYPDAIEEARAVIHRVLAGEPGVVKDPGPWVYVSELAPSSVNFTVYFWTASPQANVLAVRDAVITRVKLALDEAGIDMPYPHRVVLLRDGTAPHDGGAASPEQQQAREPRDPP